MQNKPGFLDESRPDEGYNDSTMNGTGKRKQNNGNQEVRFLGKSNKLDGNIDEDVRRREEDKNEVYGKKKRKI